MWKKISFVAVLGLSLCPSAAMAVDFNPFEGIVDGIAQRFASGDDTTIESTNDEGAIQGVNVVIGQDNPAQGAEIGGDVELSGTGGENNTQAVNLVQSEVAVMAMQGTTVGGDANLTSSNSATGTVQAVNLITTCSGSGCAN